MLPQALQKECTEALDVVLHDTQHKLNPFYRLKIYNFLLDGNLLHNRVFLILQIVTARNVASIWNARILDNPLPANLIDFALSTIKQPENKNNLQDYLQKVWEDLDIADAYDYYPDDAFAAVCSAFEALRVALDGFNKWSDLEELEEFDEETTDDDLYQWGNDSARWASIAVAGWIRNTDKLKDQKRLKFWQW